ncbi:helix-turn-helix domain-containing protein [Aeromonas piscicola]|jgi:transcriptional regulator with XRE-family HTH domain|uniref:helix-turn-helix domain-containing protein n=1 Tax=Aeromonas piscicola TaxID=600645 RepID=UPI0021F81D72|nr:helix-turn-helix transcriptional regulator [Aeromonas piscicola]MCW0504399.1 helix-turn-helix domain-containing protein [Aeromonas piscicola]
MSNDVGKKIRLIREAELVNRKQLSELTGIPYTSLVFYESDKNSPNIQVVMKILNHPKFTKYTLWFMTDKVAPEAGQVAPVLAHFGQEEGDSSLSDQKIG